MSERDFKAEYEHNFPPPEPPERCSCPCGCTRPLINEDARRFGRCWPCYSMSRRRSLEGHLRYQAWQAEQIARGEREAAEEEAREGT